MSVIDQIANRLAKHETLIWQRTSRSVTVEAQTPDGFSVSLTTEGKQFTVAFDGWHETFKDENDALNCFAFGLSDQSRLKVCCRGQTDYRWTLEFLTDGNWQEESTTGLLFFPFWRKSKVRYRQNSGIGPPGAL